MVRRFLVLGVGALALLAALGAPGQVYAQHGRGGGRLMPGFRSGFTPGFRPTPMFRFDPRFRGRMFDPRFHRGFDRFENRFDRWAFDPRFSPGFAPGFFRPF